MRRPLLLAAAGAWAGAGLVIHCLRHWHNSRKLKAAATTLARLEALEPAMRALVQRIQQTQQLAAQVLSEISGEACV